MRIGIIGAGHIGGTLTRRFSALGHEVFVANSRGPETLAKLEAETGATAVSVKEAARSGEVVIVTIPEKNIASLSPGLFEGTDRMIVVDTGNYYPQQRDGRIEGIEAGTTESRWVSQQVGRPVIKAFNNIYAEHLLKLGRPAGTPGSNNPALQCMARISTLKAYSGHFPKRGETGRPSGEAPRTASATSSPPADTYRTSPWISVPCF